MSRRHCRIVVGPGEVVIEDAGSMSGTYVNGRQVQRARLQDGDGINLAGRQFTVQIATG